MSLLQHLLTEGKEDIIRNKIGLRDDMVDFLVRNKKYKKYWISIAHITVQISNEAYIFNSVLRLFSKVFRLQKIPNSPTIDLNEWKKHLTTAYLVIMERERVVSIIDYMEGAQPTPNLSNVPYVEASNRADQWHDQLKTTGKQLDIKEGQRLIHTFEDGYYWLDLDTNKCGDEGGAMGHCGNTSANTLLSLRDKNGEPHVTVAYNYDGTILQMKGKQNKAPNEKYHEYIIKMFDHITVDNLAYQFIRYEPEHRKEDDFSLSHLGKDHLKQVYDYMNEEMFYEMFHTDIVYKNDLFDSNDRILEDLRNIFPFENDINKYDMDDVNDAFYALIDKFGDEYMIDKLIGVSGRLTKLKGMKFITALYHINMGFRIDRSETDRIAEALIEYEDFFALDTKIENTTILLIFAK